MRRLALLLAASILGTGCFVGTNDCVDGRTLTVDWPQFVTASGAATTSCAGIAGVDVYMDGRLVGNFDCNAGGVTITGAGRGNYLITVEAIDGAGAIRYRDEITASTASCGDVAYTTQPGEGFVDLAYLFYSGGVQLPPAQQVCAPSSFLWLSVFDAVASASTFDNDGSADPAYACGGSFTVRLPAGPHTLRWMEERGPSPAFALESADCADRAFTVEPGVTVSVPVNLDLTAGACTR